MQILCDLDEEVGKLPYIYPYIAVVEGESSVQFFLVAEKVIVSESDGFVDALLDLICAYLTYNIVYPNPLYPVLIFIQRFIMDIKDNQTVPPSVVRVMNSCSTVFQLILNCS